MAYLLFPLSDLDHVFNPGINISTIEALRDGTFRMTTYPTDIEYRIGRNLDSLAPSLSHRYEKMYREKLNEGRLTAPFDAARIEAGLREGLLYWNGAAWTPEPVVRTARRRG